MNNKKNAYVKKEKSTKKNSTNNTVKVLSILEQQQLFAEIIIDIFFEIEHNKCTDEK
ncbi:MAG: hypothetical protein ACOYLO_17790 [Ferruginibacter sp.]|jgi:hypothetical protein